MTPSMRAHLTLQQRVMARALQPRHGDMHAWLKLSNDALPSRSNAVV